MRVPFNQVFESGHELDYIAEAMRSNRLSGDGAFTKRCQSWLESVIGCRKALLTHSCTAALEMAALLAEVGPGDEVIMPSYTFVSTANAFVLRGAVPVFVDVEETTLNIDASLIESAVTPRTKAIVPVHYAGVGCAMDDILRVARDHGLLVIEDAAQGVSASYRGRALGSFGEMAALSFHETKNVISGEGGALLINDERFLARAEIVREKGTNRSQFFRGEVDKYTWVDIGSSYLPSELVAAFLAAQLEHADGIRVRRLAVWNRYHAAFEQIEKGGKLRRPVVPEGREINGHIYYLLLPDLGARTRLLEALRRAEIDAVFHYVPLHLSPAGRRFGRTSGSLWRTEELSDRLVRLPLWVNMTDDLADRVIDAVESELTLW